MGRLRFFRRTQLLPGARLNLSRSGPSLSFGTRGAHLTIGPRGATRTVGIPGTGLFYTSRSGHHTGLHTNERLARRSAPDAATLLRELEHLHRAGLITDDEYERVRSEVQSRAARDVHETDDDAR